MDNLSKLANSCKILKDAYTDDSKDVKEILDHLEALIQEVVVASQKLEKLESQLGRLEANVYGPRHAL